VTDEGKVDGRWPITPPKAFLPKLYPRHLSKGSEPISSTQVDCLLIATPERALES
jgi:hypothetical protein